ncbi:hypothetical protein EYF80_056891 [Liparis tanakae]|uniref:Uncharacterized protein n=1 Tax=Liparis tanakae TaxID=230148 RepID=A0A4Z2EVN2_9TELE|nr:hypothetical protein EYF80_056891 [Liparis tanakae]
MSVFHVLLMVVFHVLLMVVFPVLLMVVFPVLLPRCILDNGVNDAPDGRQSCSVAGLRSDWSDRVFFFSFGHYGVCWAADVGSKSQETGSCRHFSRSSLVETREGGGANENQIKERPRSKAYLR